MLNNMNQLIEIALLVAGLALSITFHEFMHAYVSLQLGDDTAYLGGRVSLNPLRHVDPFLTVLMPIVFFLVAGIPIGAAKPVPFHPGRLRYGDWGAALVAAAGPLTNLLIAAFFGLWLQLFAPIPIISQFFALLVLLNIAFFVFNMIPFPPLDGSRVLYAVAPEGLRQLMRQIETFGLFGVVLFIFLLYPLISPLIIRAITILANLLAPGLL